MNQTGTATYSPDDNKLRLYPEERLDKALYDRFKSAGFKWAPRQKIFVAPMWTPGREALLLEMCGAIGDEDTSLIGRSEERADRFADYSEKRLSEANQAHDHARELAGSIPFGQPILVGHHSEKKARKQADKIERGMVKSVSLFSTSEYWTMRAAGAIRHAKYKERADVRARRIKKIGADKRRQERNMKEAETYIKMWSRSDLDHKLAAYISGSSCGGPSHCFTLEDYPRDPPASQYEGSMSSYSALSGGVINYEQARDMELKYYQAQLDHAALWIAHYDNRLAYETAMLDDQGGSSLLDKKPRSKKQTLSICNYRAPEGITVKCYGTPELLTQIEMTKDEYKKVYGDYKGTKIVDNSHRVRMAMVKKPGSQWGMTSHVIFLTDSKEHKKPEPVEDKPIEAPEPVHTEPRTPYTPSADAEKFGAVEDSLKEGVQVAVAPQLFETPREIAETMAGLLGIEPGDDVLEPSLGTGRLLGALGGSMFGLKKISPKNSIETGSCTAVEINHALADRAIVEFPQTEVYCADFLEWENAHDFDRIIMNPPFINGADIKHIKRAEAMLRPGGVLVALCANGPRQQKEFAERVEYWEPLPAGSFKESGTGVTVALLVIRK